MWVIADDYGFRRIITDYYRFIQIITDLDGFLLECWVPNNPIKSLIRIEGTYGAKLNPIKGCYFCLKGSKYP